MSNKAKETEGTITGEKVEITLRPEARFHKYGQNLQCCFCKKVVTDLVGDCCGIVCWSHRFNHHFGSKQYEKARQIFAEINERRQQAMAKKFEVEPTNLPPTVKVETYPGYVFIDSENINSDEEANVDTGYGSKVSFAPQLKGDYVVVDDIEHSEPAKEVTDEQVLASGGTKFETGAVRSADKEMVAWHLISPEGLRRVAATCREGANKYPLFNWERGMPIGDLLNHAIDHIYTYLERRCDEPAKEDDLAHAAWGLIAAMHMEKHHPELNHQLRPNHPYGKS